VVVVIAVVRCGFLYEFWFILFLCFFQNYFQEDEGEKSDQDLVVDVANEMVSWVSAQIQCNHSQISQKKKKKQNHTFAITFIIKCKNST